MYLVTFQSSNCEVHRPIGYANAYEGGVNYRPLFLIDVGHEVRVYGSLISKKLYHLSNIKPVISTVQNIKDGFGHHHHTFLL